MNHLPQSWGRPRDDVYGAYDHGYLQTSMPNQHTQSPTVTGTSVIAIKYSDGVVIAADNLASYGSLARFTDVKRLRAFNSHTLIGVGGDVSDMQYLDRMLLSLSIRESYSGYASAASETAASSGPEATSLSAKNLYTWLSKVMYKRRTEFDPLWNQILVVGFDDHVSRDAQGKPAGKPFLASVDLMGTTFAAPSLATGFGAHLAQPIMRQVVPDEEAARMLDRETAVRTVRECMKVLFYRDARSLDSYSIAVVSREGIELKEDEKLENQSWAFAEGIRGYGTQVV